MGRYASIDCPVCKKPLENGEEIAVCPDCGAPYHRKCYLATGHCLYPELHEKGENWQPPRTKAETYDGSAELRCSRCGTINPTSGIFCQVCGNKLNDKPVPEAPPPGHAAQSFPFPGMPGAGGFPPDMPLNPFTTPYGGVAPEETISDIPAKDLAIFVGRNSHYFLPRFKEIANSRGKVLNWGAFFFTGGYFLYRKMYGVAIPVILLSFLLALPQSIMMLSAVQGDVLSSAAAQSTLSALNTASYICSFLSLVLSFVSGLFANTFYLAHCKKKIEREKNVERPEDEYCATLSRKGGVAMNLIIALLVLYAAFFLFRVFSMLTSGISYL